MTGEAETRYRIVRFYRNGRQRRRVIRRHVYLWEAQRHCSDPATSGTTRGVDWLDGYEAER